MSKKTHKSVFDMTDEELEAKAKPIAEAARKNAWDHGQPISYRNEICTQDDMIIREYKSGEKILITDKRVLTGNTPDLKHCQSSITLVLTQHLRKNTLYPPGKSLLTRALGVAASTVYLFTLLNLQINSCHIFCIADLVVFCFHRQVISTSNSCNYE